MKLTLTVLLSIVSFISKAQLFDEGVVSRIGVYGNVDGAYHFSDGIFVPATDRKITAGITYAQKEGRHVIFLGVGFRLTKFTLTKPSFTNSFLNELNENYVPVQQEGFDSLVGSAMTNGGYFQGTTGSWIHASFSWMNPFRPTVSVYYGGRGTPSYGPGYVKYTDPTYNDIEYANLFTTFYELRFGCSPPFLNRRELPFSACINIGYRLNDYGDFSIGSVPMSAYTTPDFDKNHRFTGCFTLALSFSFWSNWA